MSAEVPTNGRRGGHPGLWLFALLVFDVLFVGLWWYGSYYRSMPVGMALALVAAGVALAAMLVMVGLSARRKVPWIAVAVVAGAALGALAAVLTLILPEGWLPVEARVRQISDELGYTVVLPPDEGFAAFDRGGYAPSSDIGEDGQFTIDYKRFSVVESQSDQVLSSAALERYIDLPEADPKSGTTMVLDTTESMTIKGNPALAAT